MREPRRFAYGTGAQVAAYTGPPREIVINTDNWRPHVQSGAAGGVPLALLSEVATAARTDGLNLNTVTTPGRITVKGPANAPVAGAGLRWAIDTIVDPSDPDGIVQQATLLDGGTAIQLWLRRRTLAGAWEAWVLSTPANIVAFPNWRVSPGHVGAKWADYKAARAQLQAKVAPLPRPSGAKVTGPTVGSVNQALYSAVVRMGDAGRYFFVPSGATSAAIYNERTGQVTTVPFLPTGASSYNGGALLKSGRVIMTPDNRSTLLAYNPFTEAFDTLQSGLPGSNAYSGVVVTGEGLAVLIPHNADNVGVYNEDLSTWQLAPGTITVNFAYCGGILLPDGKVLCVPHSANRVAIFDPATGNTTFGANTSFPASESFFHGALIDDTRAIFFPHKYTHAVIYDVVADTWSNFGSAINTLGVAGFCGGVRLADGRFFVIPYNAAAARVLDVDAGTIYSPPGAYGSINIGQAHGGVLMDNGDVLMAPYNSDVILMAKTGHGLILDPEFVTGPHQNRS